MSRERRELLDRYFKTDQKVRREVFTKDGRLRRCRKRKDWLNGVKNENVDADSKKREDLGGGK